MNLWRLYAYGVVQPGQDGPIEPDGGPVQEVESVKSELDSALDKAMRARPTLVQLRLSAGRRSSPVRDAVRALASGNASDAEAAALELARRLASVLDLRSKAGLFVVA